MSASSTRISPTPRAGSRNPSRTLCAKNGVKEIIEVKVGYDGIVLGQSKAAKPLNLTRKDIFLALAKQVPGKDGKLIDNPYKTWKDVNAALPDTKIEVLGPPPTSGTRDAFVELAMEGGAKKFADLKTLRGSKDAGRDQGPDGQARHPGERLQQEGQKGVQGRRPRYPRRRCLSSRPARTTT